MDRYTRPDPGDAALLTVDVQNDFTRPDGAATIDGTADAVPRMARLVDAFREAERPIVHVVRLYRADGSNVDRCRRQAIENGESIVRPGTDGAEVVAELRPAADATLDADDLLAGSMQAVGPQEWYLYKPRWSAFYGTNLTTFLADRDVSTVVVCGCNFPNCPRATVYDASERDFRVVLVPDATSGTDEQGLSELADIGVAIRETDETIDWLQRED